MNEIRHYVLHTVLIGPSSRCLSTPEMVRAHSDLVPFRTSKQRGVVYIVEQQKSRQSIQPASDPLRSRTSS